MKRRYVIVGMDDRPQSEFTPEVQAIVEQAHVFSGGRRHREIVGHLLPAQAEWIEIKAPMDEVFDAYDRAFTRIEQMGKQEPIVVFASGDPLFFGIGNTIRRRQPDARLTIFPWFNSLQTLSHRLCMSYDDMQCVSLTGRPWSALDRALIERRPKIGILTDGHHSPNAIASRLADYGYTYYIMYIGERLGNPGQEIVRRLTLSEAMQTECGQPNCVILRAETDEGTPLMPPPRPFGIADHLFDLLDHRPRMITKAPIRILSLQALGLGGRRVLWDVGFCTGSVSVEARLLAPHVEVIAFEVRPECEALLSANARRFGAPGITPVMGDFLAVDLSRLPRPDAVFIGGHGGRLADMIARLRQCLLPGGCIVFNSVSADSRATFERATIAQGLRLEPATHIAVDDYNPIDIMKATLP